MIQLHRYREVQEFKNQVEPLLSKNEVLHNLALGILHSLHESSKPNFMSVIFKDSHACCACFAANASSANHTVSNTEANGA